MNPKGCDREGYVVGYIPEPRTSGSTEDTKHQIYQIISVMNVLFITMALHIKSPIFIYLGKILKKTRYFIFYEFTSTWCIF